jgi:K+/H+ antiporter YhaU regulatory subunit KhtT
LIRFTGASCSPLAGAELRALDLRARAGAAVLAVLRANDVIHNPDAGFRFAEGDQVVLIGSREQLDAAFALLRELQPGVHGHDRGAPSS